MPVRSPVIRATGLILACLIGGLSVPARAGNEGGGVSGCEDLWVERNQIYKDNGYCFKTRRAINYFGNAGCQYDHEADVPLSDRQRKALTDIKRAERLRGCRD